VSRNRLIAILASSMRSRTATRQSTATLSSHVVRLAIGLALVAFWWPVAWRELRPISDYYFFPLWLGYILSVDGLLGMRTGASPISRHHWRVAGMFLVSSALWWIFELINQVVGNWRYHAPVHYTDLEYFLLASLAFSTVVPAVLTTAELIRTLRLDPLAGLPRLRLTFGRLIGYHVLGWLILIATLDAPSIFFPLVWFALIFLLDPVVTAMGGLSIARRLDRGDWSTVFNLGAGTLICGFFWEMWNVYALPKWTYDIPYADWLHVFEMPLLGFGGYIPFGLEVYVFYELCRMLVPMARLPRTVVSNQEPAAGTNPVLAAD
jgi:hypothetical protein